MPACKVLFCVLLSALAASPALAQGTGWFFPYVEASTVDPRPLSLNVVPDGSGPGFATADNGQPQGTADASITLTLYNDQPGWGDIVVDYPKEDIWLASTSGTFDFCPGGTIADANTDATGTTWWTLPPRAGGWHDPSAGHEIIVVVSGWEVTAPGLSELRFNSPDVSGNLDVDLADVALFAQDFYGPYRYRSDLAWDGIMNLADLVRLAQYVGAECP